MASNPVIAGLAVVLDASEAQVKFAILAGRFEDYRPVLRGRIRRTLNEMENLQFSTEGSAFGNPWPPLAPSTIAAKERLGFGNRPMLVRRGILRGSLAGRNSDSIYKVSRFDLLFGTETEYAKYHQHLPENASLDKGILPERQPIPVNKQGLLPQEVMDEINDNIRDYLIEGRAT
jgi:phage gpG-like protein